MSSGLDVPAGIAREIAVEGGRVTFARFMELALTHPTEGYYSRADALLGPRGDFSTAPCLSPEFNEAVGRLLEELVTAAAASAEDDRSKELIELGGGAGDLARAVLRRWQREQPDLRERVVYTIVEVGERLRARQRRALAPLIEVGWRVAWAPTLEAGVAAAGRTVVIGNEFIDALPVHLVDVRGKQPLEAWVEIGPAGGPGKATGPRESWGAPSAEAEAELRTVFGTREAAALRPLSRDGFIEIRPSVGALLGRLAAGSRSCCLVTIDYGGWFGGRRGREGGAANAMGTGSRATVGAAGGGRRERTPARLYGRTLRGYFRHRLVTDLYVRVGRQDLTADVDFRALDLHGRRAGFETVLYTTVADMLRGDSAEDKLHALQHRARGSLGADRRATVLEGLLDDEGLGGAFRLMLQVRG